MIHVRSVCPIDITPRVVDYLSTNRGVVNLIVLQGAARNPDGDALQFDVVNAEANGVLANLRAWSVVEQGSVVIEEVPAAFSDRLHRAEVSGPPRLRTAPVWDQVDARIRSDGRYPPSWFLLLTIASIIAAVGIFTNSQILVVGAMVVGPEYSAIISLAHAIDRHESSRIRSGVLALLVGFALAIVLTYAFSLLVRAAGWESEAYRRGLRPVSSLIDQPNAFSVVVATLAGIVGVVSLVEARTGAMIGVFISVTTVPAAADIGSSVAFNMWHEAWGSFWQLLLNLVILVVVGVVGLRVQRRFWRRVESRARAT